MERVQFSCWALFALPLLGGCTQSTHLTFLDPQGPIAAAQRIHFFEIVLLVMIVVLPVLLLTPFFAWRYRYGNAASRYTPTWSFSWPLEIAVWGVPFGIVIMLAVWLWQNTQALDPYAPLSSAQPELHVQVVGYDWKWLFIYPDLGSPVSVNSRFRPTGRSRSAYLRYGDAVILHSRARKSDLAMAGMVTQLHLKANASGISTAKTRNITATDSISSSFRRLR